MLFSIAEVVKSRKNLAQITIAAAMIALASGVYTGHKLVLAYAEDILSDSKLKNCAKCKGG